MRSLVLLFLLSSFAWADEFKTYSVKDSKFSEVFQRQVKAAAAIINGFSFSQNPDSFHSSYRTCMPSEFSKDLLWSNCSGVLVGEDLVLTAAHCANQKNCADLTFAFDYYDNQVIAEIKSNRSKQYKCEKVIYSTYVKDGDNPFDLALVKLDRKVLDRQPINLNTNQLQAGEKIFAVGHPLGSPLKIQEGFVPEKLTHKMSVSMAAHAGLSGSGVYNEKGQLLGILVRGGPTFEHDGICSREIKCEIGDCPWAELQTIP